MWNPTACIEAGSLFFRYGMLWRNRVKQTIWTQFQVTGEACFRQLDTFCKISIVLLSHLELDAWGGKCPFAFQILKFGEIKEVKDRKWGLCLYVEVQTSGSICGFLYS